MLFVVGHLKMMCLAKQLPLCWPPWDSFMKQGLAACGGCLCAGVMCAVETVADPLSGGSSSLSGHGVSLEICLGRCDRASLACAPVWETAPCVRPTR